MYARACIYHELLLPIDSIEGIDLVLTLGRSWLSVMLILCLCYAYVMLHSQKNPDIRREESFLSGGRDRHYQLRPAPPPEEEPPPKEPPSPEPLSESLLR